MEKNRPYFLTIILLFFLAACSEVEMPRNLDRVPPADFVKEIPIEKTGRNQGEPEGIYQYVNEVASKLHLDSLELGYDSLQIRIWLGHSMAIEKGVVVLRFFEGNWNGYLISYWMKGGLIERKTVKSVKPGSGWNNFINQLYQLQILTLPNQDDLKDCGGCGGDGIGYEFEYATAKKYRFYSYCNPDLYKAECMYAVTVIKIADLLEKELEFSYTK